MPSPPQRSFGRGEISPALAGRADLDLYKAALSTARNAIVPKSGGIQNRSGTEFVGDAFKVSAVKEIPFVASSDDAYVLLFGHLYMRPIRNGGFVTETAKAIASITLASPGVLTVTAHGYSNGDEVYITTTTIGGMPEIGGLTWIVSGVTADTFTLTFKQSGTGPLITAAYTAYSSGGTVARLYTITTVFSASEVAALDHAQYRDVLILTHPTHPQQQLIRSGHASWAIGDLQIGTIDHPLTMAGVRGAAGNNLARYKVTYVSTDTGKESKPGTEAAKVVAAITNANPAVVTVTAHGYSDGDTILFAQISGMVELNDREFKIAVTPTFTPDSPKTIASITLANPMVVTSTAHGYSNGDKIAFSVTGMIELNDITYGTVNAVAANTFQVYYFGTTTQINSTAFTAFAAGTVTRQTPSTPSATNTFSLVGLDSTSYGVFSGTPDGQCGRTSIRITSAADPTAAAPNVLTWYGVTSGGSWTSVTTEGVLNYNIYKEIGGVYGKIGVSTTTAFNDVGYDPDISDTPIEYTELFLTTSSYPAHVAFHQQRLIFSTSNDEPQTIWMSRVGDYYNFCKRTSILDDDPITATVAGTNIDPIRSLVPMRVLLLMCQSSEVVAEGSSGDAFAPGSISVHADAHNGSGSLKALTVNNTVIFTEKNLRIVRDLFYNFQLNGYDGGDISALASHLFKDRTIVDMAYQKTPNSILWFVTSDGELVSCTYVKDQSILAFCRHDTLGTVENVCCIPEDDETALYLVVNRLNDHRYIERMGSRTVDDPDDIRDMIFVDCAQVYDGRNTDTTHLMVFGASQAPYDETHKLTLVSVTSSIYGPTSYFVAGDVGNVIMLYDSEGNSCRFTITDYDAPSHVRGMVEEAVPTELVPVGITTNGFGTATWSKCVDDLRGLYALAGYDVSVQGDGWVVANPNNDTYDVLNVSGTGTLTLPGFYAVVYVGLPYVTDLVTCDLDIPQGGTLMGKNKIVNSVTAYVNDTREFWSGESLPDDDSKDGLKPSRQHVNGEASNVPPALFSEPINVNIKARWNKGGRVAIRNIDPLPCEIIALAPDFHVGS